ncbi:MAG: hypothetical protein HY457_01785 [Parcubacteria group bacterium]|nr:hypothetical protein [Parcubacteria group bacterium]
MAQAAQAVHEQLHVRGPRDIAPFTGGRGTMLFLKWEDGELWIAGIRDVDPRKWKDKYPSPRFATPGGMQKDWTPDGGDIETCIEAAIQEGLEEAGVRNIRAADVYPLTTVVKGVPGRDFRNDTETGTRMNAMYHIFVHWGPVELNETDDVDAKEPMWFRVRDVFSPANEWYFLHVALVVGSLKIFGEHIESYLKGELTGRAAQFFERVLRANDAKASTKAAFEVHEYRKMLLDGLRSINPVLLIEGIMAANPQPNRRRPGSSQSAETFWNGFQFFPPPVVE